MKNLIRKIFTPNLFLRTLKVSDAESVQKLLSINKQYMLPWIPWAKDEPESVELKIRKIKTWEEQFKNNKKFAFGVFPHASNKLIGLTYLFTRRGRGTLEIGYILDFRESGKGYTTEASYALTKLGLEKIRIDKMLIYCNPENIASARIPEKLKYKLESTYIEKDHFGKNAETMVWSMPLKAFEQDQNYEPVRFEK